TLIFKAISEDPESIIKIIPISTRNMANKEMQSQAILLTINTQAPQISELFPSYPNPANNFCYIPFTLAKDSNLSLEIYNLLGQRIRTMKLGFKKKGSYTKQNSALFWDLKNDNGIKASKGLYFYKLIGDDFSAIKSMVVR
ncbi:MAG: T9SS type A sorting domain-containing protein, partial [bacterium]